MSKKKEEAAKLEREQEDLRRVKLPRGRQTIGMIEQRLGGSRCTVRCLDGKTRNCRIPGRLKRSLWIKEKDIVLIEPWEFTGDVKGDIIFKYRYNQIKFLKDRGYLDKLNEFEDF